MSCLWFVVILLIMILEGIIRGVLFCLVWYFDEKYLVKMVVMFFGVLFID